MKEENLQSRCHFLYMFYPDGSAAQSQCMIVGRPAFLVQIGLLED